MISFIGGNLHEDGFEALPFPDNFLHRAGCNKASSLDDGDFVAELFGDFQNVCGEENRSAAVAEVAHEGFHGDSGFGIEADEGFVKDEKFWFVDQSGDDRQFLLHPVGIGRNRIAEGGRDFEGVCVALDAGLTDIGGEGENIGDKVEVLDTGKVFEQIGIVGDIGDGMLAGQRVGAEVNIVDVDFAGIEAVDTGDGFERGGFSGAVMTDEGVQIAGSDMEGEIGYAFVRTGIVFGEVLDVEHGCLLYFEIRVESSL